VSNFLCPLVNSLDCRCRGECSRNTREYGRFEALRASPGGPVILRLTPEDSLGRENSPRLSDSHPTQDAPGEVEEMALASSGEGGHVSPPTSIIPKQLIGDEGGTGVVFPMIVTPLAPGCDLQSVPTRNHNLRSHGGHQNRLRGGARDTLPCFPRLDCEGATHKPRNS
jgi:hypothetical protein